MSERICEHCGAEVRQGLDSDEWVQVELAGPSDVSGAYKTLSDRVYYHPACFGEEVPEREINE